MSLPKAWIAWSSGKDSAWALHVARKNNEVQVVGMLTTITEPYARVSMHGVREQLLIRQSEASSLPMHRVKIPAPCSAEVYEDAMRDALEQAQANDVTHIVFGDIFLEDLRAYREKQLARIGMQGCFPLWKSNTRALALEMTRCGLSARITCIDPKIMPRELAGAEFNEDFISQLPGGVDPLGENGEFHTFVCDGPMFKRPIKLKVGETLEREGFVFTDLIPARE